MEIDDSKGYCCRINLSPSQGFLLTWPAQCYPADKQTLQSPHCYFQKHLVKIGANYIYSPPPLRGSCAHNIFLTAPQLHHFPFPLITSRAIDRLDSSKSFPMVAVSITREYKLKVRRKRCGGE